ncbi:hypothetical protein TNCV_1932361 [Trichonephila clavipes]|nr:hypothetical protein TNCV_1932361 [Trichonephila clavipes]
MTRSNIHLKLHFPKRYSPPSRGLQPGQATSNGPCNFQLLSITTAVNSIVQLPQHANARTMDLDELGVHQLDRVLLWCRAVKATLRRH